MFANLIGVAPAAAADCELGQNTFVPCNKTEPAPPQDWLPPKIPPLEQPKLPPPAEVDDRDRECFRLKVEEPRRLNLFTMQMVATQELKNAEAWGDKAGVCQNMAVAFLVASKYAEIYQRQTEVCTLKGPQFSAEAIAKEKAIDQATAARAANTRDGISKLYQQRCGSQVPIYTIGQRACITDRNGVINKANNLASTAPSLVQGLRAAGESVHKESHFCAGVADLVKGYNVLLDAISNHDINCQEFPVATTHEQEEVLGTKLKSWVQTARSYCDPAPRGETER